jgi:hypothetical protein
MAGFALASVAKNLREFKTENKAPALVRFFERRGGSVVTSLVHRVRIATLQF